MNASEVKFQLTVLHWRGFLHGGSHAAHRGVIRQLPVEKKKLKTDHKLTNQHTMHRAEYLFKDLIFITVVA